MVDWELKPSTDWKTAYAATLAAIATATLIGYFIVSVYSSGYNKGLEIGYRQGVVQAERRS